jgi:hypothetical protein
MALTRCCRRTRAVGILAAQGTSSGTVGWYDPGGERRMGAYRVLACADDLAAVTETSETNNCLASATTVQVTAPLPDLTTTAVSFTPASVVQGGTLAVTDTVTNQGPGSAGASTTR